MHRYIYCTLHYSTVAYIFFWGGVTTEGEPGQKRPKTTGRVAMGSRVSARGQAEFEFLFFDLRGA